MSDIESVKMAVNRQLTTQLINGLIESAHEKCFERCVSKPGSVFSSYEQKCMSECTDKYLQTREVLAKYVMTNVIGGQGAEMM